MKYVAILKDSLREAVDSKVLLVMLILSTVMILFVGTFSFSMLSAERTMEQFFPTTKQKTIPLFIALNTHKPEKLDGPVMMKFLNDLGQYRLKKVELLNGEPDAPESEYLLTIALEGWNIPKEDDERVRGIKAIFKDAVDLDYIHLGEPEKINTDDPNKDAKKPHYRVKVQGTRRFLHIWAAEPNIAFGAIPNGGFTAPMGYQIYLLAALILKPGSWVAVLTGVIITSFFIPNMLRKGTIDFLLVKPIHRWLLLIYKYIGGLTFVFLCTAYTLGGVWLMLGLRTGLWPHGSLLWIFTLTFFFAILYAVSSFVAVLTRSTVTAIVVTSAAWLLFSAIGTGHQFFHNQDVIEQENAKQGNPVPESERWGDSRPAWALYVLNKISPRTEDLNSLNDIIVYTDFLTGNLGDMTRFDKARHDWLESLLVSALWIAIFLGLASFWFTFKDY